MIRRDAGRILYLATGTLAVIALAVLGGCSRQQGSATASGVLPLLVNVSPSTANVAAGSSYQFSASIEPASAQNAVRWSVSGAGCSAGACGSIDSSGKYSAPSLPPSPSTVTLIATSVLDQTKLGEATVTVTPPQTPKGAFHSIGNMLAPRSGATATLLQDGRVLISGGEQSGPVAELYNPATGTFQASGANMTGTPVLLNDGEVLFVGAGTAGLYDPKTDSTTPTGHFLVDQQILSATLLSSGKALVLGEHDAEIYDPASGSFSYAGPYAAPSGEVQATGLADSQVLIMGSTPPQLFDPSTNTFSLTGSLSGTALDGAELYSATLLQDGGVLVAGGMNGVGRGDGAVIYDPSTGKFSPTGSMNDARDAQTAVALRDGSVLVLGGDGWSCSGDYCYFPGSLSSAELYDPATGSFSRDGYMNQARTRPNATLLQNGDVLITGGFVYCGIGCLLGPTASAEIYHPQ